MWDGDQLAYTQTFKHGKLDSQRHSIFHGWQLIAQQDRYQHSQQTIDGNKTEWKNETSYAICQPNGQPLALLNPQGKSVWRKEKSALWGLLFPNEYRKISPLDPQMLFAGQWFDDESGLAYNRFRYYDPESGNYISSDPIGLNGGERPFGYVHNPMDWVDLFGLAKTKTNVLRRLWKDMTGSYPIGHIHHGLPEQFADQFKTLGNLDVNNAKYFYDLTPDLHVLKPNGIHTNSSPLGKEWNKHWKDWLDTNENRLTKLGKDRAGKIIERHLKNIAQKAGISDFNSLKIKKCKG